MSGCEHYGEGYHDGRVDGYDAGWLAAEAAEQESLRRHRTELDRVRQELRVAIAGWDHHASTRAGGSGDRLADAALKLLAITASRAALPGEE